MASVCVFLGGLSSKRFQRGGSLRTQESGRRLLTTLVFSCEDAPTFFFSGSFPHKALLSSLSRSDVFVHTSPAPQKKGEILFTSAFDIHLLFLQPFQGVLFAQWNRLCLEEVGQ